MKVYVKPYMRNGKQVNGYYKEIKEKNNDKRTKIRLSEEEIQGQRRGIDTDKGKRGRQVKKGQLDGRPDNVSEPNVWSYTSGDRFHECLEEGRHSNRYGCCVDNHSADELNRMKMFLSEDQTYGVAVEDDGNICCAFNYGTTKGVVPILLKTAKENGGTKMDCYGRTLVNMYEQNGFKPVAKIPFNADYVDKTEFNKVLLENKFDVYALCLCNNDKPHISTQDELDNLPTFEDYDEALKYRDNILKKELLARATRRVKK